MKKITLSFFIPILLAGCQLKQSETLSSPQQIDTIDTGVYTGDWSTLNSYLKSDYLKGTDFFKNPIVVNELKRILVNDYESFCKHVLYSDLIYMNKQDNLIYLEVIQLHSGGYDSMIFIDIQKRKFTLFWLPGTVSAKTNKIYGERPIPENILKIIVNNMNEGWGHVAKFSVDSDSLKIELDQGSDTN
jgi:hypothetical protein